MCACMDTEGYTIIVVWFHMCVTDNYASQIRLRWFANYQQWRNHLAQWKIHMLHTLTCRLETCMHGLKCMRITSLKLSLPCFLLMLMRAKNEKL